jgi:hypothetical protein
LQHSRITALVKIGRTDAELATLDRDLAAAAAAEGLAVTGSTGAVRRDG